MNIESHSNMSDPRMLPNMARPQVGVRLVPKFKIHISRGAGPTRVCLEPVKVK